jgi:hypothetical protein
MGNRGRTTISIKFILHPHKLLAAAELANPTTDIGSIAVPPAPTFQAGSQQAVVCCPVAICRARTMIGTRPTATMASAAIDASARRSSAARV